MNRALVAGSLLLNLAAIVIGCVLYQDVRFERARGDGHYSAYSQCEKELGFSRGENLELEIRLLDKPETALPAEKDTGQLQGATSLPGGTPLYCYGGICNPALEDFVNPPPKYWKPDSAQGI